MRTTTTMFLSLGFLCAASLAASGLNTAHARVDPRAFLSGQWSGTITTTQPACGSIAASESTTRRTFVIERRHGGLTLREPGTNARCRLVLSEDGLIGVPGRCRLNTVDVSLSLEPGPNSRDGYVLSASSDGASCASTSTGTVTRR
jgi:hypothetical protein